MKKTIIILSQLIIAASFLCTPPAKTGRADETFISTVNEKIWLAPLIDLSGIPRLSGWSADTVQHAILARQFDDIRSRLLAEFRRCEKYGHYQMVHDSLQSTIRVFTILGQGIFLRDTLCIPITVSVTSPLDGQGWNFRHEVRASAPVADKERNPFHYSGLLMVELCNSFPCRQIVYPFYKEKK
jgi:hypothetical protein